MERPFEDATARPRLRWKPDRLWAVGLSLLLLVAILRIRELYALHLLSVLRRSYGGSMKFGRYLIVMVSSWLFATVIIHFVPCRTQI